MTRLKEFFLGMDRVQKSLLFKVLASGLILLLAIAAFTVPLMVVTKEGSDKTVLAAADLIASNQARGTEWLENGPVDAIKYLWATVIVAMDSPGGILPVGLAVLGVALVSLLVVWLRLGLTYFLLLLLANAVAWPLMMQADTRELGQIFLAMVPLGLSFFVMMEGLRLAFSGTNPVLAVARNVVNEAVRMKVSLVFIVILLLLMAVVPGLLNEDQQLRYRVQQWLQYGVGLSYMVLAFLTLFLSAATVAYEQRDRIIWQTMSKPVAPWQYVLGKWVGVMGLNAVLLTVTSTGVFLFTEYLSRLPASGEVRYMVREDGGAGMTEDREILTNRVLVARVGSRPLTYLQAQEVLGNGREEIIESLADEIQNRLQNLRTNDPQFEATEQAIAAVERQVLGENEAQYFTVPVHTRQAYIFELPEVRKRVTEVERLIERDVQVQVAEIEAQGDNITLDEARVNQIRERVTERYLDEGRFPTLMLQYKIHAGSNDPSAVYKVFFFANGLSLAGYDPATRNPVPKSIALKSTQTLHVPSWVLDQNGRISLEIGNAIVNSRELNIPPDGLEMMYVAGGYQTNFFRIMCVIWLKLGFIAAVAIALSTFLFMAESAGFLEESLTQYTFLDKDGNVDWQSVPIRAISLPVVWLFGVYADLKPTSRLVDGRLVGWGSVIQAVMVLGLWTLLSLGAGWAIFRKRELALYSGH